MRAALRGHRCEGISARAAVLGQQCEGSSVRAALSTDARTGRGGRETQSESRASNRAVRKRKSQKHDCQQSSRKATKFRIKASSKAGERKGRAGLGASSHLPSCRRLSVLSYIRGRGVADEAKREGQGRVKVK